MQGLFHTDKKLILASASPRRQHYLQELGIEFEVRTADIDECRVAGENPEDFVQRMAVEKARAMSQGAADAWVLAADTIVVLGDRVFGKPQNDADAIDILMELSGKSHTVYTAFCLCPPQGAGALVNMAATQVTFSAFSRAVAAAYVATGEPRDKAGAYGIQGKGVFLVQSLSGSYSNVVGLPLNEVVEVLVEHQIITPVVVRGKMG